MAQALDPAQVRKTTHAQTEVKLDSPAQYKTFFSGAELIDISAGKAVIGVPNPFTSDWLRQKHEKLIAATISHVYGEELLLEFIVSPSSNPAAALPLETSPLLAVEEGVPASIHKIVTDAGLNPKYTMQAFVVGDSNRIGHAAASAVINSPGTTYNPLFIYGDTGVGKTHLAQAVGRSIIERSPGKKIVYTSSEGFLNDLVRAIRSGKTAEFRSKYRAIQVLIIDDVQLISKWVSTQAEFFNTFNELYNNSNQIILISDRRPEDIIDLEDRLRSRFQGGMVVDISKPDFELRLAILERKANQSNINLSRTIMEMIAREVTDNIRELEGALQKVGLFNQMKPSGELTLEEVAHIIGSDNRSKRERVKVSDVIKHVASSFGVKIKDIKGPRRTKDVALARQVTMHILREDYGYKLEEIASLLGRSDHTTVMHAVDKIQSLMLTDAGFKEQVRSIMQSLNAA
ncbi:chromosomal replication initiator protein DnaA [Candidatus Dojkabacteria bacterium]|uniref:Chromosomal replication initiator protein DnaA n=1 Tax=Candidatus Dojkabacteria bacterium TaxID=2099670 RepID=A0A955I9W0_9BACT|nr:chromosomal replication initiator protein DnaA [Candidatus Dojkabacteria bacterium]